MAIDDSIIPDFTEDGFKISGINKGGSDIERDFDTDALFAPTPNIDPATGGGLLDSSWAKSSFLFSLDNKPDSVSIQAIYGSSADFKFTDTQMGGMIGMGGRPQFTRYSDIRSKGVLDGRSSVSTQSISGNYGMGRIYSESIDDPSTCVYMRFGVPQFNSLDYFLRTFSDPNLVRLATSGRTLPSYYTVGTVLGTIAALRMWPLASISILTAKYLSTFVERKTSRFYSVKPLMHHYWASVNLMVNAIAINRGFLPNTEGRDGYTADEAAYLRKVAELFPNMVNEEVGVDVHMLANRAQRRAHKLITSQHDLLKGGSADDWRGMQLRYQETNQGRVPTDEGKHSMYDVLEKVKSCMWYSRNESPASGVETQYKAEAPVDGKDDHGNLIEMLGIEWEMGSNFAILKVDAVTSTTESFSNSVKTAALADKFNSASATARDIRYNMSGGNIGDSAVTNASEGLVSMVAGMAKSGLNGMSFGVTGALTDLLAGVTMEMPKYWESADAELPAAEFSMTLISPYNNVYSHLQNIYIPLCMLLSGMLPRMSGRQSHVSPFVCLAFCEGRTTIDLGMLTNVSITRGVSNLPWDMHGHALALDVTFTITNLSAAVSVPFGTREGTGVLTAADGKYVQNTPDEDSAIFEYLAMVSGLGLMEQLFVMPTARRKYANTFRSLHELTSPAYWASFTHHVSETGFFGDITGIPGSLFGAFSEDTGAVLKYGK